MIERMTHAMHDHLREITDVLVAFDPETLARQPVAKHEVVDILRHAGQNRAAQLVERLPERDGMLDAHAIDRLLVHVHCELQRLSEEFQHGQRMADLLRPMLAALRQAGAPTPLRVLDVGCGTGYVMRWLARNGGMGEEVELLGADYNAALIAEARRLANAEKLRATFLTANAFRLDQPATLLISTGVLHHFRGDELRAFFAGHASERTAAFIHFDFQPSWLAPIGSWLFHFARFREPIARHDGVLSAVRAHSGRTLLNAAKQGLPQFDTALYNTCLWGLPVPRPFHVLVGMRPALRGDFLKALGWRRRMVERWA